MHDVHTRSCKTAIVAGELALKHVRQVRSPCVCCFFVLLACQLIINMVHNSGVQAHGLVTPSVGHAPANGHRHRLAHGYILQVSPPGFVDAQGQ